MLDGLCILLILIDKFEWFCNLDVLVYLCYMILNGFVGIYRMCRIWFFSRILRFDVIVKFRVDIVIFLCIYNRIGNG